MTYEEFINNILNTRGRFACGDEYHERHHIVPKCMGGGNEEENLIDLFAREHFEAHRLLALENPENDSLVYAWWMMAHTNTSNQRNYEITGEEYEEARVGVANKQSRLQKERMSIKENRKRISDSLTGRFIGDKNPNYGRHLSEDAKQKISEAQKGRCTGDKNYFYDIHMCGEENPFYGHKHTEESKKKMSKFLKGRVISEEHKQILSIRFSGDNNPMYGKYHTEETRKKISQALTGRKLSEDTKLKMSKNRKGSDNANSKITCQYDLNMNFINIWKFKKQAAEKLNINSSAISMCCLGTHKTAGGYQWKYLYDQIQKDGTIIPGAITLGLITEKEALRMLEEQKEAEGENENYGPQKEDCESN